MKKCHASRIINVSDKQFNLTASDYEFVTYYFTSISTLESVKIIQVLVQVIYGVGSNNISEKKQYWGSPAGQAVVPWWCNTHRGSCCVWALRVTVSGIPHLIGHRSMPVILSLTPTEATRWPGSQNCTKTQLYPDYSLVKSPTQSHVQSRFIHQFSNCCSFWMQDHAQTNYCSVAVCIENDTMISLDISHIYGALFIDLPKVSDTVDRTFLLQQFKRDTDFTVAWFSSNIIGHWVLWGSWHCNSTAASVLQRRISYPPHIHTVGLVSFASVAYSLATTHVIPLRSLW